MSGPAAVQPSSLPALSFLAPFAAGAVVLLGRRLPRAFAMTLTILGAAFTFAAGIAMLARVTRGPVLEAWGNELRVDALSALLVAVIGGIGLVAACYSLPYVSRPGLISARRAETAEHRLPTFYGLVLWFLATMTWGCVTNNIVMLYVAVEATTLCSGLLVAFYWDRRALEAGYKYLMLLTIGITFALLGCVLLYANSAATGAIGGHAALLMSEMRRVAHLVPPATALLVTAFLIIGFGTKAGIAPFHPWLPDAHAEAPTPISALLSGVMIKMAIYALARTVSMFLPTQPALTVFIVALGAFTMLIGAVLALVQDDLKRLLAYSSVSQMGYVLAGLGLGTYLGCFGGLFHVVNHALEKSLLFMCVGAIIYSTGIRRISQLGGLGRAMPITGACFFAGGLALAGLPPFNGFMSKLTIYLALADRGLWWAAAVAIVASVVTMVVVVRAAYRVFWGVAPRGQGGADALAVAREVPAAMWIPMALLGLACLALGLAPQVCYPALDQAARALATLGR